MVCLGEQNPSSVNQKTEREKVGPEKAEPENHTPSLASSCRRIIMTALAFDSLRFARRLREAGVPEPQADVQAELMAEAFGFYADNILTRDYFEARLDARFVEQDAKLDKRFADIDKRFLEQDAKFEGRFSQLEKVMSLHTWMLGIIVVVLVVPQLQAWLM
jgi:hypothetical protein